MTDRRQFHLDPREFLRDRAKALRYTAVQDQWVPPFLTSRECPLIFSFKFVLQAFLAILTVLQLLHS